MPDTAADTEKEESPLEITGRQGKEESLKKRYLEEKRKSEAARKRMEEAKKAFEDAEARRFRLSGADTQWGDGTLTPPFTPSGPDPNVFRPGIMETMCTQCGEGSPYRKIGGICDACRRANISIRNWYNRNHGSFFGTPASGIQ